MRGIALLFLLASPAHAWVPLPSSSSGAVNSNFMDIALEMKRNNLRDGGEVKQNLTISSSLYVTGGTILGGTVSMDGDTLTLTNPLAITSHTKVANTVISGSSFGQCVSTVTVTLTQSAKVMLTLGGAALNSASAAPFAISFLQDGAFVSPWDSTYGVHYYQWTGSGALEVPVGWSIVLPAVSAGEHSWCVTMRVSGVGTTYFNPNAYSQFGVVVLR